MVKKIGKYELGKTLGSGTFGKVKYAVDTSDPNRAPYAIKVLDRKQIEKENMQDQLKNEIAIMKLLKHENIVIMHEVIQSAQHIYIILEIVTGGELFDRIVAAKRFDEATARRYFQQLILGVGYCHRQGVAHRDLKPENLLVGANDNLKISDFGLSAMATGSEKSKLLMTTCGTPHYVAPEVLEEKGYNGMTADVWSCGVILFVMLAGYLPFEDATTNGLFVKIERGEYRMPKQFTLPVKTLIGKMLTVDPTRRITVPQILDDPWFQQGLDPKELENAKTGVKKVAPTAQEVDASIKEGTVSDEGTAWTENQKRQDLTAFELASKLVMGGLSPLVTKNHLSIRRNTQFMASGTLDFVMTRIKTDLEKHNARPQQAKNEKTVVKGYINTSGSGVITYSFVFVPTVCVELVMVECRRMRGDTLEFQKFYREVVRRLVDIVPTQPAQEEILEYDE
eukprot:NODE_334_length_1774_cov_220.698551_g270_i0.p1 GENE.NODE_334_length_1774_cov_220.698551_g270_i0~~NODE_334_length_1774_cov_220.698551_g270_i0.p1  ORF type:complete len:452 (-),score=103.86 NODE_334_length_1774_cov_220.698551_g270_i0:323-1678(-)